MTLSFCILFGRLIGSNDQQYFTFSVEIKAFPSARIFSIEHRSAPAAFKAQSIPTTSFVFFCKKGSNPEYI